MCLSLHSPVSFFSSITSLLPYAGVDNSRLPSLSQEPLTLSRSGSSPDSPTVQCMNKAMFLRAAVFQTACLPSFFWPTFPISYSLRHACMILLPLPPCPCYPQLLSPPILAFLSLPWVLCCLPVACRWTLPRGLRPSPWPTCPSLLYNNMRTRGTMIAHRRLGVTRPLQHLKGVGITSWSGRARDDFQMQGAGKPVPSHAAGTKL